MMIGRSIAELIGIAQFVIRDVRSERDAMNLYALNEERRGDHGAIVFHYQVLALLLHSPVDDRDLRLALKECRVKRKAVNEVE